jgi:DNA-directed RNA polymerase specialized sigma54-like protein
MRPGAARLQQFDPVGVFARDLKECLTLQLRDRNRLDSAIQALLDNLELLADCLAIYASCRNRTIAHILLRAFNVPGCHLAQLQLLRVS